MSSLKAWLCEGALRQHLLFIISFIIVFISFMIFIIIDRLLRLISSCTGTPIFIILNELIYIRIWVVRCSVPLILLSCASGNHMTQSSHVGIHCEKNREHGGLEMLCDWMFMHSPM